MVNVFFDTCVYRVTQHMHKLVLFLFVQFDAMHNRFYRELCSCFTHLFDANIHIKRYCPLSRSNYSINCVLYIHANVLFIIPILGRHSSLNQDNCSFCDKSTKFGRYVEIYIGNKTGYWAITNSHSGARRARDPLVLGQKYADV